MVTRRRSSNIMHLKSGSAREIRAMHNLIGKGPVTVMLVFSKTCPHCTTYMPIWKELCKTNGRKANMVSMEASTYQKTDLAAKKPVSGVPTVLYVNKAGEITEARDPRNTTVMTNAVRLSSGSDLPVSVPVSNLFKPKPVSNALTANSNLLKPLANAVIPETMTSENPLKPIPASVQSGGNPWAAFVVAAAKQAAPAAMLLGAYATLPYRSSGLSAPRRTRRRSRSRSRR